MYIGILCSILICLCGLFSTLDLYLLYIFFEGIIIPIFFLIGIWGSRTRKIYASYLFFFYTMLSSVFILFAILLLHSTKGSSNMLYYSYSVFSNEKFFFLFMFLFLGFAVKIPIIPLHI